MNQQVNRLKTRFAPLMLAAGLVAGLIAGAALANVGAPEVAYREGFLDGQNAAWSASQ